jgi:hypothetical protein
MASEPKTALATRDDAPIDYAGGLLEVIARAARDPSVDIDKMERLLAMQERVQERNAKTAFTEAKIAMRPELPEITMKGLHRIRDKTTQDYPGNAVRAVRGHSRRGDAGSVAHGFDLSFRNGLSQMARSMVTTILSHVGGHTRKRSSSFPMIAAGARTAFRRSGPARPTASATAPGNPEYQGGRRG